MSRSDVNRREFLKIAAPARPGASSKMIGIQVGAVSFVDEGTERVLDVLQERACSEKFAEREVNTTISQR